MLYGLFCVCANVCLCLIQTPELVLESLTAFETLLNAKDHNVDIHDADNGLATSSPRLAIPPCNSGRATT